MRLVMLLALALLLAPAAVAAPLPSTCTTYQNLNDVGLCETACEGEDGNARTQLNTFFVVLRGVAPCDGSEGYTYGHVIFVVGGVAAASGDYGGGRQTAAILFVAGVAVFADWHEYEGACTTTVGVYDAHGWPYYAHDVGCPLGSAPTSPDPGYGSILP